MQRHVYDVLKEPRGELYRSFVRFCGARSEEALLVLCDTIRLGESARDFVQRFQGLAVAQKRGEWPGTRISPRITTVFRFHITPDLIAYLETNADGLYDWQQPERLEDLCFLRADGSVVLATIAHEKDAWLELNSKEHEEVTHLLPTACICRHRGGEANVGRDWRK